MRFAGFTGREFHPLPRAYKQLVIRCSNTLFFLQLTKRSLSSPTPLSSQNRRQRFFQAEKSTRQVNFIQIYEN